MLTRALAPAALLVLALAPLGCATSQEAGTEISEAPSEDPEYSHALDKATQKRVVLKDFETRWRLSATYLSPEFRTAFAKRLGRVYLQDASNGPQLDEAASKAGFLVSLQAADVERLAIDNPQHWTIVLNVAGTPTPLKPVLIKKLPDKERWRAFFDGVDFWTTDYLLVFDTPSVDTASAALVEKSPMRLTFANADGKVHLDW